MLCKPTYYIPLHFRPLGQIRVFKVHHLTMLLLESTKNHCTLCTVNSRYIFIYCICTLYAYL